MGQRSFLYLKDTQREVLLFEANNSLPFFWLLLAGREAIERRIQDWQAFEQFQETHTEEESERYLEAHPHPMMLSQATCKQNIAQGRAFLQRHFPGTLPLLDDFARTILSRFTANDRLEIDISQFSAFYPDTEAFYTALRNEANAITADQPAALQFIMPDDLVAGGSGFEGIDNKDFATLASYRAALERRSAPAQRAVYKADKKSRAFYAGILLLCPLFSILVYKMYRENGLNFKVVLTALLNIGFYIFSAWSLIADIKTAKQTHR